MIDNSFGKLMRYYRRSSQDKLNGGNLSQDRLADLLAEESGITYSRGAISDWERSKGHIHKDTRHLLISLIRIFYLRGGIQTLEDANSWLEIGNYRRLNRDEINRVSAEWLASQPKQIKQGELFDEIETASTTSPFQAPALPPHFVGRQEIVGEVAAFLTQPVAPRLALVGMGGIGKTTLASQIAHQLRDHFVDGVLWATANEQNLAIILEQWGQAFGYDWSQVAELENRAAAFRNCLADKQVLIVLDDLVLASQISMVFPNTPHCAILVTTRDHDVAYALDMQLLEVGVFPANESLQLLCRIVGSNRVQAAAEDAQQICDLLDHLPLAVEILAQRLRSRPHRSLSQVTAELTAVNSRLAQLQIKDRVVRASFELSWTVLDYNLQRLFALLAVFEGRSFSSEAISTIAREDMSVVGEHLETLVALSLLSRESASRYRQHALLADFAFEQLSQMPDQYQDARLHVINYYEGFIQKHLTDYATMRPEWPNIYAAIQSAAELNVWMLVQALVGALTAVWFTRARYREARDCYPLALEAGEQLDDQMGVAQTLLDWGKACVEMDAWAEGKEKLLQALVYFQEINAEGLITDAMLELGRVAIEEGAYESANQWLMEAQALAEKLGDDGKTAVALYRLARLHHRVGDDEVAKGYCSQALALRVACDYHITIRSFCLLASIFRRHKAYEKAQMHCQSALALARKHHDKGELATTMYLALSIAVKRNEHDEASRLGEECMVLFKQMGAVKHYALTLYELSMSQWRQNNRQALFALLEESFEILHTLNDNHNLVNLLLFKGIALDGFGENKQACEAWQAALSLAVPQRHALTNRIRSSIEQDCD